MDGYVDEGIYIMRKRHGGQSSLRYACNACLACIWGYTSGTRAWAWAQGLSPWPFMGQSQTKGPLLSSNTQPSLYLSLIGSKRPISLSSHPPRVMHMPKVATLPSPIFNASLVFSFAFFSKQLKKENHFHMANFYWTTNKHHYPHAGPYMWSPPPFGHSLCTIEWASISLFIPLFLYFSLSTIPFNNSSTPPLRLLRKNQKRK